MASTLSRSLQDQASAILSFAYDLQSLILSSTSSGELSVTDDTLRTLAEHLNQLPLSSSILSTQTRHQLDSSGTQLWNTCMWVMAACGERASEHGVLSKLQCFSFAILESVAPRRGSGNLRALELALRTAKFCLKNEHLEPSLKALEAAAERLEMLKISESNTDKSKLSKMTTEYYMLRIYLSWLQGRPDIGEHLFSKVRKTPGSHAEKKVILEICCAVGMSALSKGQFDKSVRWLERALESSSWTGQQGEQPDLALKDMRLLALHAFVRAHLQLNESASWSHIYQSLNSLRAEYRDILPVVMLRLEVFSKEEQLDYEEYFQCLQNMVRMMDVTEESLMVAFYHIKKLGSLNWEHSREILQRLLLEKITPSGNQAWAEQYFVGFAWMVTSTKQPAQQDLGIIAEISKEMMERGCSPFSEEACHASLTLIWRKIDHAISNHDFLVAEKWCLLALEKPLFQNCSLVNKAIFQRKLITCATENKNTLTTHIMVKLILEQSRDTPSTLYLVYKMALLHQWHDLERIALEALYRLGANGSKYILLCAALLEAQCLGKI